MHDDRHRPLIDPSERRSLVRAAARLLGPAEAEDAVQDAYVRALESATATRGLDAVQAWLLTVVRHLAIDRLRRRQWMQQWLTEVGDAASDTVHASPSAEADAALAQESARAMRLLATRLAPADGAAVLLYEVFEASHAEMAQASGKSEAGSRQQLRRALLRLRQADASGPAESLAPPEPGEREEAAFRVYLQALQLRDPQALWAMLGQPPVRALAGVVSASVAAAPSASPAITCGVVQVGGQLGLVLTLDGVRLCVLPLGVRAECETLTPVAV